MGIPSPLAFPPTALRNVAAGLVVGNPIGSSGTRGKALTAAELKSIVEASGISYLPLSGGTLTGPITGTSDTLIQRRGINTQCFLLNKSYTSDASQEALMLDAGKQISGKLGLYSYRGSSGGSNNPIQIGMLAANGTTFSGLTVGTDGAVTPGGAIIIPSTSYFKGNISQGYRFNDAADAVRLLTILNTGNIGVGTISPDCGKLHVKQSISSQLGGIAVQGPTTDSFLATYTDGTQWFIDPSFGSTGSFRDLVLRTSNTARLTISVAGVVTAGGQFNQVPPSSVTLANNGQFSIEMTSNTAGNLVYRGSDGTTRRMALTFV